MPNRTHIFTIVVPVFQNAANLEESVPRLLRLDNQLADYAVELLFVDDGSSDGSRAMLADYADQHPNRIRVVLLSRNFGQNAAIQAGLRHARGNLVGIISCDLQEPCEQFIEMVKAWEGGAMFVIGERIERLEGICHRMISTAYWRLVRSFAFPDYPRLGYDFCLIDRQLVDDINRINEKNTSIFVLIYWLGYKSVRVPVIRARRRAGRSQWNMSLKLIFAIDTLIGFTYLPSRIITAMGITTASLAFCYLLFVAFRWITDHAAPPGWMTVVGLVTLLGSLNLFAVGILSEYLLRILDEARKRPPFIVDRIIESKSSAEHTEE